MFFVGYLNWVNNVFKLVLLFCVLVMLILFCLICVVIFVGGEIIFCFSLLICWMLYLCFLRVMFCCYFWLFFNFIINVCCSGVFCLKLIINFLFLLVWIVLLLSVILVLVGVCLWSKVFCVNLLFSVMFICFWLDNVFFWLFNFIFV